ncbi:unnamed protein product, partial [Strongylus vulgaris]
MSYHNQYPGQGPPGYNPYGQQYPQQYPGPPPPMVHQGPP